MGGGERGCRGGGGEREEGRREQDEPRTAARLRGTSWGLWDPTGRTAHLTWGISLGEPLAEPRRAGRDQVTREEVEELAGTEKNRSIFLRVGARGGWGLRPACSNSCGWRGWGAGDIFRGCLEKYEVGPCQPREGH